MTQQKYWLVLPDEQDEREDTKSTALMSDTEMQEYISKGYYKLDYEQFNKLLGNSGAAYLISHIDGSIYEKPPYVPSLEELKNQKYQEIKDGYLKDLYAIVWVEQDNGKIYGYDTDKDSQVDFSMSLERAKINGTSPYNVYTNKENLQEKEFLVHTPEMFEKTLNEAGSQQVKTYEKYYQLKLLIEQAESEEALKAISW